MLAVVGFIALIWVVATIVQSQLRSITQVYEGYWGGWLSPLKHYGEERHRVRLGDLRDNGQAAELYARYPLSRKEVRATRLGNILRALEMYPNERYGADAVLVWPRLYPLLPDAMVTGIGQSREALEFLLLLSSLAATFGVLSGIYLLVVTAPVWVFLAGTVVIPLPVRYDSLDGVDPGVRVNLLLAPTGPAGNPTVLTKVEVVEEKKTAAGDQIVFLAIPASCQQAVAQIAGRGRVILARLSG